MEITKIELFGYRNYEMCEIEFDSKLNVICGENAQGKTNLLEAVYYCVVGKSFRASREKEVINLNKKFSQNKSIYKKRYWQ